MTQPLFPEVRVNGEVIPPSLIAAEAQNHAAPRDKPGLAWRKAAQALTIRSLLLQEARARGLAAQPQEQVPGKVETEDEALIRALLDQAIDIPPPSDSAIRAEWARNPSRHRSPPLWDVSHILCACDPSDLAARSAAEARAKALHTRLTDAPDSFAKAAAASDCPSRQSGGHLGQLAPGDTVPEFEAALHRLGEGEVSPPILSRHGWHIIRLNAVAPGQPLPYAVARARIAEGLERAAWARATRALVEDLARKAEITGTSLAPI